MNSDEDFTEDRVFGGAVRIRQPRRGYRVNADTLLLAAAVKPGQAGERLIELGCGVGGALLASASKAQPGASYVGLERDAGFAKLARENAALNNLNNIVEILEADAQTPPEALTGFDQVFFNPPYAYEGEGRAPAPERRSAHVADAPISQWIVLWSNRMRADARMTMIIPPERALEALAALDGRLGAIASLPVFAREDAPARRMLIQAAKGSRAPARFLRGLVLHDCSGAKHTREAEAVLRGAAPIVWD